MATVIVPMPDLQHPDKSSAPTFSYRDALMQSPKKVETSPENSSTESSAATSVKKKLKQKVKEKIDHMLTDAGGAFLFLCGKCFTGRHPRMKMKSSRGNFCDSPARHHWDTSKVLIHRSQERPYPLKIRRRPPELQLSIRAKMCVRGFQACRFEDRCRHPHNQIEVKVWNIGNVSHEDIVKRCTVDAPASGFCCNLCSKIFQVQWELENHTNTQEHKSNMTLDQERPWEFREPPDNIINGEYLLCPRYGV